MPTNQKMARINVDDETWFQLRLHALRANRSLADYLGELIEDAVSDPGLYPRPAASHQAATSLQEPRTHPVSEPGPSEWIPPWEI